MAYGDIGAIIETLEFDAAAASDCWAIHVSGDVYAVAYLGTTAGLTVATVEIDAAGDIGAGVIATYIGTAYWGTAPHIIKIADGIFAVATQGAGYHLTVETLAIADDGSTITLIEKLVLVAADCRGPKIIHVAGDIYAVSYLETAITTVKVSTFTISVAGDIDAIIDTIDLTAAGAYYTNILAVNDTIFAVQHVDTVNGVTVATVEIDEHGAITNTVKDTQIIDAQTDNSRSGMTEALTGVFAIAHAGTDVDGYVSTVTIDAAGAISAVVDTLEIYIEDVTQFHIIHIGEGICAITHLKDVLLDGTIVTVSIDAAGDNITIIDAGYDFETTLFLDGMLLLIDGDIYALFYSGVGGDGFVISLDISTPPLAPAEIVHHEMLMGIGP